MVLRLDKAEVAVDSGGKGLVVRRIDGEVWREECGKWFWP